VEGFGEGFLERLVAGEAEVGAGVGVSGLGLGCGRGGDEKEQETEEEGHSEAKRARRSHHYSSGWMIRGSGRVPSSPDCCQALS
jgi:hypothetical protein